MIFCDSFLNIFLIPLWNKYAKSKILFFIKQKRELTTAQDDKKNEVVYDGNTEDTPSIEKDSSQNQEQQKPWRRIAERPL